MIFTSPPFGNSEFYDGHDNEYKNLDDYIDAIFDLSKTYLNDDGIIVIHTNTEKPNLEKFEITIPGLFGGKKSSEHLLVFKK